MILLKICQFTILLFPSSLCAIHSSYSSCFNVFIFILLYIFLQPFLNIKPPVEPFMWVLVIKASVFFSVSFFIRFYDSFCCIFSVRIIWLPNWPCPNLFILDLFSLFFHHQSMFPILNHQTSWSWTHCLISCFILYLIRLFSLFITRVCFGYSLIRTIDLEQYFLLVVQMAYQMKISSSSFLVSKYSSSLAFWVQIV